MGWVTVNEPFAALARVGELGMLSRWSGVVEVDRGLGELREVTVEGGTVGFDECEEVDIKECRFDAVEVVSNGQIPFEIVQGAFVGCELNQVRVESLRRSTFIGSKLIGVDFGGATLVDVVFDGCVLHATNLRGANLARVHFTNCTIADADAYGAELADVAFAGSVLSEFNIDRVKATRVDLRGATELGLTGVSRLGGFLIAESQIPGLMEVLALASGVGIEAQADR